MRFDQRAQPKELGQRCIEGHCVIVNAIFKVSVIHMCLALAPSPPSTPYHAVRKVCSGNTTPGVDPLIIAVLHHHAAHKIHVNAVFEGAAGVGGAAVACCPPIPQWASRLRCSSSCVPSPTSTPDPTALNLQGPNPSRDLVLGLLDTGGRETVLKGVRIDVEWILRS